MTTTYPNSFLAFPFLSVSNGVFRFGISSESVVEAQASDLGVAGTPSIILFDDNSTVNVSFSGIDLTLFTSGSPSNDDYVLYYDNADGETKKATITDILGAVSAAPTDATYVTLSSNATLTNESVLAVGSGISLAGSTLSADYSAVQAKDATLTSIALLGTTADRTIYTTGSDTWAETTLTSFARTLLDDIDAATARGTLGLGTMSTQASSSYLSVANNLSDLGSASTARTNLGVSIGVDVQAWDALLDSVAALTDPNADRILFWDDSAGAFEWLTLGTNLSITGTTINATGGSGGGLADGDYGDITVSSSGTVMNIDAGVVTTTELGGDITTAGKALLDDASASDQRTTLGLGTLATQSGTFSGTSSGTNTGDQNLFSTIAVSGQSDVVADSTTDTLTLAAGSGITITTNASTDTITIAAGSSSTTDYLCGQTTITLFPSVSGTSSSASLSTGRTLSTTVTTAGARAVTGTTSTGRATCFGAVSGLVPSTWSMVAYANVSALSDATNEYNVAIGVTSLTTNPASTASADEILFVYDRDGSGGRSDVSGASANWRCITRASSTSTSTTSSVAVKVEGTDVADKLEIVWTSTSDCKFYINDSLVATHTTNVPTVFNATFYILGNIVKSAGTTSRTLYLGPTYLEY
jgi:hypothetical protein